MQPSISKKIYRPAHEILVLFVLILYVLENNFSVMSVRVFLRKQHSDSTNKVLVMIADAQKHYLNAHVDVYGWA